MLPSVDGVNLAVAQVAQEAEVTPTEGGAQPSSRSRGGVKFSGLKPVLSA